MILQSKNNDILLTICSVFLAITYSLVVFNNRIPTALYIGVCSLEIAVLVLRWSYFTIELKILFISIIWYSLFWIVRDALFGFYAQATFFENYISLLPTIVAFVININKKSNILYIVSIICLAIVTYITNDTGNEVLLVLAIIFTYNCPTSMRKVLITFIWYQAFLASSKYTLHLYNNKDIIYLIGLTPFFSGLLYLFLQRKSHNE